MLVLLAEEMDNLTATTLWASIAAAIVLAGIIVALSLIGKKLTTRTLAMAGVTLALSYVLSLIRFAPVTFGGEITLAGLLPIIIFAYFYGFLPGLLTGIIFGLLEFMVAPYVLTPFTFLLDYVFAYSAIAIVPLFSKAIKNKTAALAIGITVSYAASFAFHVVSGIIYFDMGAIWAELPASTAIGYSLLYNVIYLVPDCLIVLLAAIPLSASGVIDKLKKIAVK